MDPKNSSFSSSVIASATEHSPQASITPSNNSLVSVRTTPLLSNLNQACSIKLDRNNYILWQYLVLPIIKGHKLEGYLFGTKACPAMILSEGAEKRINPEYEEWTATEQLLLGWLFNTMTVDIASQLLD